MHNELSELLTLTILYCVRVEMTNH